MDVVTEQWEKYQADIIIEEKKSGTSTGHEDAENIAKGQKDQKTDLLKTKMRKN